MSSRGQPKQATSGTEWHGAGIWSKPSKRRSKKFGKDVRMFYVRVRWLGERYSEKAGTTYAQALKLLGKLQTQIDDGKYVPPLQRKRRAVEARRREAARMTFADFADKYLETQQHRWKRGNWHADMVGHFKDEFGEVVLEDLDRVRIEAYLAKRRAKVQASTLNHTLRKLRTMLSIAVEWDLIPKNPATKIKTEPEPEREARYLDDGERAKLIEAADPTFRPMLRFAILTGMRWGEIAGLRWRDVDAKAGMARLAATATKTRKARTVPLNADARAILSDLPTRFQGAAAHVFMVPMRPGGKIPKKGRPERWTPLITWEGEKGRRVDHYRAHWNRAMRDSAIDHATPHCTRHAFAGGYLMRGGTVPALCKICGWSDWKMVEQRYSHFIKGYLQDEVSIMNGSAG